MTRSAAGVLVWLRKLLFGLPPRMTREEVLALAAEAARTADIKTDLRVVTVTPVEGRLTWFASTATIGSGWSVKIDDATGEVGPVTRWGLR